MKDILRIGIVCWLIGAVTGLAGYGIYTNDGFHPKNALILTLCLIIGIILAYPSNER